jgi:hypothetical protein
VSEVEQPEFEADYLSESNDQVKNHGAMLSLSHALSQHDASAQRKVRLSHLCEGFNRRVYGKVQSSNGNPVAL